MAGAAALVAAGGGNQFLSPIDLEIQEMEKSYMRRAKQVLYGCRWADLPKWAAAVIILASGFPARSMAQQQGQKTFSSAEQASSALIAALQSNDEKAMLDILGPDGKEIVSSGDDTEDANTRANFVQKYQEMHRLVKRAGRNHHLVHWSGELAHAHPSREQGQFVVFRHRCREEGNPVQTSGTE